jgi:tRNA(Ile)-lysidine synthase
MYHVFVPSLHAAVVDYVHQHELLKPGDRVGIAVSGGADSVGLLRLLVDLRSELGTVLSVVHLNHKLRGSESDDDERFVGQLAQEHDLELFSEHADVAGYASERRLSLETAAREMRYQFFRRLLGEQRLNHIATAHTLDDQAETVLLRIARGAGTRGLAGIYPRLVIGSQESGVRSQQTIIRPLLSVRRKDLELYLQTMSQLWREDRSNRDLRHSRNRVRHGILPRLERNLNPAIREALAETAEIARAEEDYWQQRVTSILGQSPGRSLDKTVLRDLPLALQRRVLRRWAEANSLRLEFHHVDEILEVALDDADSPNSTCLPDGWIVTRKKEELQLQKGTSPQTLDYEFFLPIPGSVEIPALNLRLEAVFSASSDKADPDQQMNSSLLGKQLYVRNWRAGDRFWPCHSKGPKKIKELLQDRHITGESRKSWPVATVGDEIVWVRGFPVATNFRAHDGQDSVIIREAPLTGPNLRRRPDISEGSAV